MARTTKNRELNLLAALDRGKQRRKADKGTVIAIALVAVVCASAFLFWMQARGETDQLTERRDAALAYTEDPATIAAYNDSLAMQQQAQSMQAQADALTGAIDAIEAYPDMTGSDYKNLFRIAGGKVDLSAISYDRQTGTLAFDAKCSSATRIPIFISALRSSGIFSDVTYGGYAGGEYTVPGEPQTTSDGSIVSTEITKTEYAFSVVCLVNTDDAKTAAEEQASEEVE
jgi:hypothetical protein